MEDTASRLENLSRREFTKKSALAMLSGVAITIVGCSSDSPTTPTPTTPPPSTPTADVTGTVSANHGHTAVVTGAALTAGGDLSLDITGSSNHPHTVALAAADLTQIQNGQRVSKESSTNSAHNHTVTFN